MCWAIVITAFNRNALAAHTLADVVWRTDTASTTQALLKCLNLYMKFIIGKRGLTVYSEQSINFHTFRTVCRQRLANLCGSRTVGRLKGLWCYERRQGIKISPWP